MADDDVTADARQWQAQLGDLRQQVVEQADFRLQAEQGVLGAAPDSLEKRAIERAVLRAPEQYLWMHRIWKSRPRTSVVPLLFLSAAPILQTSRRPDTFWKL